MMRVRLPGWFVTFVSLITPNSPIFSGSAGKQFEEWARTASFDNVVLLVRLAGVFAFPGCEIIHLPTAGRQRSCVLSTHPKKKKLRDVTKVKSNAAAVGAAVLAYLVPHDIGFVREAPSPDYRQSFR